MASEIEKTRERPTLNTVAAAAGVSRMTVSNAYNRPDQLSTATRERVLEVANRLGYCGPDPTAASLRLRRTDTIGVVLTERLPYAFTDPGLITILHGIATELSDAGTALLLVPAAGADGESLLRQAKVDALILCSLAAEDPSVSAALSRHLPTVTVGTPRLAQVPFVGADNKQATALVARRLLELGHARFAVVTTKGGAHPGPSRPIFGERVDGLRRALVQAGIEPAAIETVYADDNSLAAGRAAAGEIASRPAAQRPTAVFAVTDILALGALDAVTEAGLAVPRELSVVGFDDIAAAATSTPTLTTVAHDLFGQGRAAARIALRMVAGTSGRSSRFSAKLVERASTGPAPYRRAGA